MTALTIKAATAAAGTLGFPSKMPGTSYGLPAQACITGAKLATVPGSTTSLTTSIDYRETTIYTYHTVQEHTP